MTEVLVLFDYEAKADDELTIRRGDVIRDVTKMEGGWWEGNLGSVRGMFPDNFVKVVSEETTASADSTETKEVEGSESSIVKRQGDKMRRRCVVLFSYAPQHEDELPLAIGEQVDFIEEVEEGWWRGSVHGKTGVFPSNFVSLQNDGPNQEPAATSTLSTPTPLEHAAQPSTVPPASESTLQPVSEVRNPLYIKQAETPSQVEVEHEAPSLPPKPVREMARVIFPYVSSHPDELDLKEGELVAILSKECEDKGWWKGQVSGRIGVFPDNFVESIAVPATAVTPSKPLRPERPPEKPASLVQPSPASPFSNPSAPISASPSVSAAQASPPALKQHILVPEKADVLVKKDPSTASPLNSQLYKSVSAGSVPKLSFPTSSSYGPSPKSPLSAGANLQEEDVDLDSLTASERSPNLQHLTTSRPAGPKRRPPSQAFNKEQELVVVQSSPPRVNGHATSIIDESNNNLEDDGDLIRPHKEKNSVPWLKELSEKQESRFSKGTTKEDLIKPGLPTKVIPAPLKMEEEKPYVQVKPSAVAANKLNPVVAATTVAKVQKIVGGHKLPSAPMMGVTNHVAQKPAVGASSEELQREVNALRTEVATLKDEVRSLQQSQGAVLSELSVFRRLLQDNGFGNSSLI